jgi:hypothetical protein
VGAVREACVTAGGPVHRYAACPTVAMWRSRRLDPRASCQLSDGSLFDLWQMPRGVGTVRPGGASADSSADSFIFARWWPCSTPVVVIHERSAGSLMARYSLSSSCQAVWDSKVGRCLGGQLCI